VNKKAKRPSVPKTPECEKLAKHKSAVPVLMEFPEYLESAELEICNYHEHSDEPSRNGTAGEHDGCFSWQGPLKDSGSPEGRWVGTCSYREGDLHPTRKSHQALVHAFFGINEERLERERLALLEYMRKLQ
jgi:hypothetical protein